MPTHREFSITFNSFQALNQQLRLLPQRKKSKKRDSQKSNIGRGCDSGIMFIAGQSVLRIVIILLYLTGYRVLHLYQVAVRIILVCVRA
jgi:hypothetical protein